MSQLLKAFSSTNTHVPVWFMRQAGRYLPEYQALKKNHTLNELFRDPAVAAQITLMPIDILNVDAAIMFADILTLPAQMGFQIDYIDGRGPVIANPINSVNDVSVMRDFDDLSYIAEIIKLVKKDLKPEVAMVGFAGAPFTILTYLIEGGSALHMNKTLRFMMEQPREFDQLMSLLTDNIIRYLKLQQAAGIDAFQLFDTWAGSLRAHEYRTRVFPYVQKIFAAMDLPSIYYLKNSSYLLDEMKTSGADIISLCETIDIATDIRLKDLNQGVQGNFYNQLLFSDEKTIEQEVNRILNGVKSQQIDKYIFNLSHGVFPKVRVEVLKQIVEQVHQFNW